MDGYCSTMVYVKPVPAQFTGWELRFWIWRNHGRSFVAAMNGFSDLANFTSGSVTSEQSFSLPELLSAKNLTRSISITEPLTVPLLSPPPDSVMLSTISCPVRKCKFVSRIAYLVSRIASCVCRLNLDFDLLERNMGKSGQIILDTLSDKD